MVKCPYCNRLLEEDERYCFFCKQDVSKVKDAIEKPQLPKPKYYKFGKPTSKKPKKEKGYLYYVDKQGDISRTKMARGEKGKQKKEKIIKVGIKRKKGFLYYVDKNLNIKAAPMKWTKK